MSQQIELVAEARADVGKGASRRLRRNAAMVPGIVYGGGEAPVNISLIENDLSKAIQADTFFSQILALKVGGTRSQVLARDMQRHPATNKPMHIDFQRILANQEITVQIPLHFINEEECIGVKEEKGLINHHIIEVDVTCLPKDLPEAIIVDVGPLKIGDILHLSDLKLPAGVVLEDLEGLSDEEREEQDLAVVSVHASTLASEMDAMDAAASEALRLQHQPKRSPRAKRHRTPTKAEPWPRCVSSWAWEIQARDTTALPTMSAPNSSRRSQRDSASPGPMSRSSRGASDADTILGHDMRLLIPNTFMNLSGESVGAVATFFKFAPAEILVAHDEMAFEPGVIRLKRDGGHNGHNGLRDIIESLGNNAGFVRLRIGVGHPGHKDKVSGYLTGAKMRGEDRDKVRAAMALPDDLLALICAGEFAKAMNVLHTAGNGDA